MMVTSGQSRFMVERGGVRGASFIVLSYRTAEMWVLGRVYT